MYIYKLNASLPAAANRKLITNYAMLIARSYIIEKTLIHHKSVNSPTINSIEAACDIIKNIYYYLMPYSGKNLFSIFLTFAIY